MPSSALTLSPKWTGASQRIALHKIAVKMVRGIVNNRETSVRLRLARPMMVPTRRPAAVRARPIQAEVAP